MSDAPALRQAYLAYLTHERRLAANTIGSYQRDLDELIALVGDNDLAHLQPHQIRRFAAQLHSRGLGGRSIARMLSAWRGWFHYLVRDHGLKTNPCMGVRAPKSAKRLPHALSPDEATRLMNIDEDDSLLGDDEDEEGEDGEVHRENESANQVDAEKERG